MSSEMLRHRKRPLEKRHLCVPKPRFPVAKLFFAIFILGAMLAESRWLSFFPLIFPAPSWVPRQVAPLIGVPWKPEKYWYSQFGQDKWAASESCFEKEGDDSPDCATFHTSGIIKTGGFFVELGSHDGITNSNTKTLEDRYSWSGVCIEPDPLNYRLLSYHRPRCTKRNVLVGPSSGSSVKFVSGGVLGAIFGGMGGASGIHGVRKTDRSRRGTYVTMKTVSLTSVLDDANAPRFIDYLSLDVEGNEHAVLTGLDHSKYKFGRITVEHNFEERTRAQVHQLLSQHGYLRVETGSPNKCVVSQLPDSMGMCMSDETKFCPCVDDFYVLDTLMHQRSL